MDFLGRRLAFCGRAVRSHFDAALSEAGGGLPTWVVLLNVASKPGMSQTELADCVGVEGPTLVRHLDRLCQEGMVERRRDAVDRRVIRVELMPAGQELLKRLTRVAQAFDRQLAALFTRAEYEQLGSFLARITDYFEETHAEHRR